MNPLPEPIRIAQSLGFATAEAATELRRVHEINTEMLEALESIAECCDEEHHVRSYASRQYEIRGFARRAIAKATGAAA